MEAASALPTCKQVSLHTLKEVIDGGGGGGSLETAPDAPPVVEYSKGVRGNAIKALADRASGGKGKTQGKGKASKRKAEAEAEVEPDAADEADDDGDDDEAEEEEEEEREEEEAGGGDGAGSDAPQVRSRLVPAPSFLCPNLMHSRTRT